jgi:hypothetical protein
VRVNRSLELAKVVPLCLSTAQSTMSRSQLAIPALDETFLRFQQRCAVFHRILCIIRRSRVVARLVHG